MPQHRLGQRARRGEEPRRRFVPVLGLPDEVGRDHRGSAESSAITAISEGPAKTSMPTWPNSMRFASATNLLPGPTMMSARLPVNKPYAMAAIACTPPSVMITSAPATCIA